jgi:hypothetical protein
MCADHLADGCSTVTCVCGNSFAFAEPQMGLNEAPRIAIAPDELARRIRGIAGPAVELQERAEVRPSRTVFQRFCCIS